MTPRCCVVKVGGSLFDLPDLRPRLLTFLDSLPHDSLILVPGGGACADVVRELDRVHRLGESVAHDLAMRAVSLNAWLLAALVPTSAVTGDCSVLSQPGRWIVDGVAFTADLPGSWAATSDSLAALIAAHVQAEELILLKSVDIPDGVDWKQAAQQGWVDTLFPTLIGHRVVRAINLRALNHARSVAQ